MGAFPSGQRGQTVNLLSVTSVVRIHPLPPEKTVNLDKRLTVFSVKSAFRGGIDHFMMKSANAQMKSPV